MRFRITEVTALCLLFLTSIASGRNIIVPGDQPDLHQALTIAVRGDRILLQPGRHEGSSLDLVDGVAIIGDRDDPGSVIVDGGQSDRVFRAEGIEAASIVGVTIVGGEAQGETSYSASGGGVFVSFSHVTFQAVHFVGNAAQAAGGCIRVSNGEVIVEDCRFIDGRAVKGGGAIDLSYDAVAQIRRSVFRGNSAAWGGAISARTGSSCWIEDSILAGNSALEPQQLGGAFFADYAAQVVFTRCVLTDNTARLGGAARLSDAISSFVNCTIVDNAATDEGGAFMVRRGTLHLDHDIVAFNDGSALSNDLGGVFVTATDIFGNQGGNWDGDLAELRDRDHNLETDPLFCADDDLHLQDDSPCAAENSRVGVIGALEVGCTDLGIQLQQFQAAQSQQEIVLTWQVSGGGGFEFRLRGHAHSDPDGPTWPVAYDAESVQGRYRATDEPVDAHGSLEYILDARPPGGDWFHLGDVVVNLTASIPPEPLVLDRVYPNPFNPQVTIRFTLNERSPVNASIYDIHGRMIYPITRAPRVAGSHILRWDGIGEHGRQAPTGTYILRIEAAGEVITHKLVMIR